MDWCLPAAVHHVVREAAPRLPQAELQRPHVPRRGARQRRLGLRHLRLRGLLLQGPPPPAPRCSSLLLGVFARGDSSQAVQCPARTRPSCQLVVVVPWPYCCADEEQHM